MRAGLLVPLLIGVMQAAGAVRAEPLAAQGSSDEMSIRADRIAQNEAIAAGNLDSLASFWTGDVEVTTGLGLALHGRAAYQKAFSTYGGLVYERITKQVEVSPMFPLAWEEGTWTGRQGAAPPSLSGRYTAQWVRVNGRWLIRSELFVALSCGGRVCSWPVAQHPS